MLTWKVSSGLSHDPYWCPGRLLSSGCPNDEIVSELGVDAILICSGGFLGGERLGHAGQPGACAGRGAVLCHGCNRGGIRRG
jgi:hypothetical protein